MWKKGMSVFSFYNFFIFIILKIRIFKYSNIHNHMEILTSFYTTIFNNTHIYDFQTK